MLSVTQRERETLIAESSSRNRRLSWLMERQLRPQYVRAVSRAKHARNQRRIASAAALAQHAADALEAFEAANRSSDVDR